MTRLVLVRHGESVSTVSRRIGGHRTCGGLSPLGQQQAERLRLRWTEAPDISPTVLISSHYRRAKETAAAIAAAFGLPVVEDASFGEHDPGADCDGMTYDDFMARFGEITDRSWHDNDPFDVTFPGGETVAAFHYRVGAALKALVDHHRDATVVVSCHGGVIDAVLRTALRAPSLGGFQLHTRNTSITELETIDGGGWRVLRYNDIAHLAGLPEQTPVEQA
jgi:2,3-bisphosphoglycerate-dependent phosphoglycerate mutase